MKKYTSINSADEVAGELHPALAEIETEAFNAGYDVIGSGLDIYELRPRRNDEESPKVDVTVLDLDGGQIGYDCTVTFPELRGSELPYADSVESRIKSWLPLARVITRLQNMSIDPTMYEEDE